MIHLNIDKRYQPLKLDATLTKAAQATLAHQKANEKSELSVAISGDRKLKTLNKQFRNEDHPTDVLSFPSDQPSAYLGDVVISLPRARAQAKAGGHSLKAELQLLTVHGVLHLLGQDHANPQEKERMWTIQAEILQNLGLSIDTEHAERPHA